MAGKTSKKEQVSGKPGEKGQECSGDCATCEKPEKGTLPKCEEKAKIDVKHVVLVLSGKGGVGKSTVSVNLAFALSAHGYRVGLLDLDIHGPTVPKMLGIEGQHPIVIGNRIEPVRVTGTLAVMSMAFLLPTVDTPVIWRGPMKMAAITQFLNDVDWGPLDFLVVDLPPGTGDEALSIAQIAPNVRGAVVVTTPQDVATIDSRKAVTFIGKLGIPVLGIVENMSGMICPHCKGEIDLFGKGGGKRMADEMHVPFLGSIPIDPDVRKAGDEGRPFIIQRERSDTWKAVDKVMEALVKVVES